MTQDREIEELFRSNYEAMHRLASMMLHDADAAHDVVHDIFASVIEGRKKLARADVAVECIDELSVQLTSPYLLRCVRNSCLNRLRSVSVRERFAGLYVSDSVADDDSWPDDDTFKSMEACIDSLPPRCREVFNLRFKEGMDTQSIMKTLEIGERAVYKHLRNALDTLRSKLCTDGKN